MKELQNRGQYPAGGGSGAGGGATITEAHAMREGSRDEKYNVTKSEKDCCTDIERLQKLVDQLKAEKAKLEENIDCGEYCADALKKLKDLQADYDKLTKEAADCKEENSRLNTTLKEQSAKLTDLSNKLAKIEKDSAQNIKETAGISKDLAQSLDIVKEISDVHGKNEQLAGAVNAINSRDDQKIIDDLRRQLADCEKKNKECQKEKENLENELKAKGVEIEKLKTNLDKAAADKAAAEKAAADKAAADKAAADKAAADKAAADKAAADKAAAAKAAADKAAADKAAADKAAADKAAADKAAADKAAADKAAADKAAADKAAADKAAADKAAADKAAADKAAADKAAADKAAADKAAADKAAADKAAADKATADKAAADKAAADKGKEDTAGTGGPGTGGTAAGGPGAGGPGTDGPGEGGPGTDGPGTGGPGTGGPGTGGPGRGGPGTGGAGPGGPGTGGAGSKFGGGAPGRGGPSKKYKADGKPTEDPYQQFVDENATDMQQNLKGGAGLEKELRRILDAFIQECGFCFCKSSIPKSKFYAICHKILHNGIQALTFRELLYMHKKIYLACNRLHPGCLLNMIITENNALDGDADQLKCCSCKSALCCNNSEEMLKEKVSKLERDIEMAKEYLDNFKTQPQSSPRKSHRSSRGNEEYHEKNLTYRSSKPTSKCSSKQMKTLKARILKCSELLR